jgi:hypothetical protein
MSLQAFDSQREHAALYDSSLGTRLGMKHKT